MTGGLNQTRILLWLAALFLSVAGCSDSGTDAYGDATPALWQIQSESGAVEGWLFGTIHALPDGTLWQTDSLDKVLDESDLLVVEVANFENAERYASMSRTTGVGLLSNRVSSEHREQLLDMLAAEGLRDSSFYNIEDWAAAMALARLSRDGDPANGVDRALIEEFRNSDPRRPIEELEGLRLQLSIFDNLPAKEQQALLDGAVERYAEAREGAANLRALWLAGNMDKLGAEVIDEIDETPLLFKTLLADRNLAMAEKVAAMLSAPEKPFVAVGAAHMVGDTGLPALIEREGYRVRRIQ